MNELPESVRPALRRLSRRLALGLFLDAWPLWAAGSLALAGVVAIVSRLFLPAASSTLPWLLLTPLVAALPAGVMCYVRWYRPAEIVALADALGGGHGLLLTLFETGDRAWAESPRLAQALQFPLPQLRPWRRLAVLPPAAALLAGALWLPQRVPSGDTNAVLAEGIAADLSATLLELEQQALITPAEEKRLEEEVERIRRAAEQRVDSSSWEASDAFRERVIAGLSEKQKGLKWAEASLGRYQAAARAGAGGESSAAAQAAELTAALEALSRSGLLEGAPADLQSLLRAGKLPKDAGSLNRLAESLSGYLAETNGRFNGLARLGKEFGRFDPAEFPLEAGESASEGDGTPGAGGITRGRADAPLTWGKESLPLDRFKAVPLPAGAPRSPDDWAPLVVLPGVPRPSPSLSAPAAARQYAAAAGQNAWRRTLTPRHQSAVKKYFEK
jgi:hypothetical protein